MQTSPVSTMPRATIRRAAVMLGMLCATLATAACAQTPSIDSDAPPLEIPADYEMVGRLTRALCAETFRVGDTVSAVLSRSDVAKPIALPRRFLVLLRRGAQTGLVFSSLSADADGYHISGSIGTFVPDVESRRNEGDRPPGECYPAGGRVNGQLSRPLRIPRMK